MIAMPPARMAASAPPRLFGIVATKADTVAVIRRGPTDWCHVGAWDTHRRRYQSGSWIKGKIFPQRCDLSPDGQWFCYMAYKASGQGELDDSYVAISRLPYLEALAAWSLGSTYSRGLHFADDPRSGAMPEPNVGSVPPGKHGIALRATRAEQFAVERRRGWRETADSPPRAPGDMWDEGREARLYRDQPHDKRPLRLTALGSYAAFREMEASYHGPTPILYAVADGEKTEILDDVQWADWSRSGELLVATHSGTLEQRRMHGARDFEVVFAYDLASLSPDPQPPPAEAAHW